jgi:hypothetical protein
VSVHPVSVAAMESLLASRGVPRRVVSYVDGLVEVEGRWNPLVADAVACVVEDAGCLPVSVVCVGSRDVHVEFHRSPQGSRHVRRLGRVGCGLGGDSETLSGS